MSEKANRKGCIYACWIGLAAGLATWLIVAGTLNNGALTIATTYQDYSVSYFRVKLNDYHDF